MVTSSYSIAFNFKLEDSDRFVTLTAQIEKHHSKTYYTVKDFRSHPSQNRSILPDIMIKKVKGRWVHCDSEKESNLSIAIGKAIMTQEADRK